MKKYYVVGLTAAIIIAVIYSKNLKLESISIETPVDSSFKESVEVTAPQRYEADLKKLEESYAEKFEKEVRGAKPEPLLDKYLETTLKALPSHYELNTHEKFMTDIRIIKSVANKLLKPSSDYSKKDEDYRILAAKYLIESLSTKNNPNKEYIVQVIETVVLDDNLDRFTSDRQKRSVVADKVFLFSDLLKADTGIANLIENKASQPRVQKWIEYAKKHARRKG